MNSWKVLTVDDEPPIRAELRYLLEQDARVAEVQEAGSVSAAMLTILEEQIDIVFLDISMPGTSGMQLAEFLQNLTNPPAVVFVTAYAEFAADAYNLDAVDYVLKPVELDRVEHALDKVEALRSQSGKPTTTEPRMLVEQGDTQTYILINTIVYVEARGNYANVYTKNNSYLVKSSMSTLEKRLATEGFIRIHKSFIVNKSQINKVHPIEHGLLELSLHDRQEMLPISRRKAAFVKAELGITN
ncbi:LytR/AlgR family response regulator transcription factor [Atopobium fossor]|uniref:LytR/AlgR family response regulator transcription factor n=1 Tax=Atopobium fossor TaxID=39487 RepID=UPI00041D8614|nr:LytTR family DNA-binding domain-containing protein [Atopobium fossor]